MRTKIMQLSHAILGSMTPSVRDFLISIGITAPAVFLIPEVYLIPLFVVLGQGHFFLMYLYQYRAGKIGNRYLRAYLAIATLLFLIAIAFSDSFARNLLLVLSAIAFGLHFFFDELFMYRADYSMHRKYFGVGFGVLYVLLAYTSVFPLPEALVFACTSAGVGLSWLLAAPLLWERVRTGTAHLSEVFLLLLQVLFTAAVLIPIHLSLVQILAFMVLFHYVRWYLFYAEKLKNPGQEQRMRQYIRDCVLVNGGVIALYALYWIGDAQILAVLFSETYFYLWTTLHVIFALAFFQAVRVRQA